VNLRKDLGSKSGTPEITSKKMRHKKIIFILEKPVKKINNLTNEILYLISFNWYPTPVH